MLTTLLALLSSSGVGSIVGLLGGLLNRGIDLKAKAMDQKFELDKIDKQKGFLELEIQGKTKVAEIEGETAETVAGYTAMTASYGFAATTSSDGWVDKASKFVRPALTLAFFIFTCYIFYQIHLLVGKVEAVPKDELFELYKEIIQWFFFQAGVAIGWWFAMRPGKVPTFGGK